MHTTCRGNRTSYHRSASSLNPEARHMDTKRAQVRSFSAFAAQSLLQEAYPDARTSLSSVVPTCSSEQNQCTVLALVEEPITPTETQHRSPKRKRTNRDFSRPIAPKLLRPQSHRSESVDSVSQIEDLDYESTLTKAGTRVVLRTGHSTLGGQNGSESR